MTYRITVVCTGNICRSAYVEYALQAQLNALLGDRGRAEVTSAGTEPNQALTVPGPLLDLAAEQFAAAVTGAEGVEGTMAFVQKRKPKWAE